MLHVLGTNLVSSPKFNPVVAATTTGSPAGECRLASGRKDLPVQRRQGSQAIVARRVAHCALE
jgi:hypothetical protein